MIDRIGKKLKTTFKYCFLLAVVLLVGCLPSKPVKVKYPPIVDGWRRAIVGKSAYIVQKKDTIYSIAWALGLDYRDLVEINNLTPPYSLRPGQRIYITSSQPKKNRSVVENSVKTATPSYMPVSDKTYVAVSPKGWIWPAKGKVVTEFANKPGSEGVDIQGCYGSPILASNFGRVVYSGTGIRSYGKLLIIKHSDDYLSAYAYNDELLVYEGQKVKTGQQIATMGKDNERKTLLHFEIRRVGEPVDPLLYLSKKS